MSSQGPNAPLLVVNDTTQAGTAWATPTNASAEDGLYATVSLLSGGTISNYLKPTFAFTIPLTSTVDGIILGVKYKGSIAGIREYRVFAVKSTTISATNKADTSTAFPTVDTWKDFGGAGDLWGLTWTPAEINSSLGFVYAVNRLTGTGTQPQGASVDMMRATVHYTAAGVAYVAHRFFFAS